MSRRASRHGGGGRTGQHYNATPQLRSYTRPPAGPVTVTKPDGSTEVNAPLPAKRDVPKPRQKKAAANRGKPVKQPLKAPTVKQLQSVSCPACHAAPGEPCTLRSGHRARAEAYRAGTDQGVPVERVPVIAAKAAELKKERQERKRQPASPEEKAKRAVQSAQAKAKPSKNPYKNPNARAVGQSLWSKVTCPRCKAAPGMVCIVQAVKSPVPHRERVQVVRRAWAAQQQAR